MMKTHQTIRLSAHRLHRLDACQDAIDDLTEAGFLPVTISTDPEANLELAERLVDFSDEAGIGHSYAAEATWLGRWIARAAGACESDVLVEWSPPDGATDFGSHARVLVLAQNLAMAADKLLSARGK